MNKLLITGFTKEMESQELLCNKDRYADKWGWDFICKRDDDFDHERPFAFSKIPWIDQYLENYDLVAWIDFDSIITNFRIDISEYLTENNSFGMFEENPDYFCAGNILIKSDYYSKAFFYMVMQLVSWNNMSHPWEQRCINELLSMTGYRRLQRFNQHEFGAFNKETGWCKKPWIPGDFMLHLCSRSTTGFIPWEDRMKLFEREYKDKIIY